YTYNLFYFFQAEDCIRDFHVTGVQTCALPISLAKGKKLFLILSNLTLFSRSLMVSRLSNSFFPFAKAITSLASPLSFIKRFKGIMVNPEVLTSFSNFLSSLLFKSNFLVALGLWL